MENLLTTHIELSNDGLCYYDKSKQCCNVDYITGAIQYIVPPCYTCEYYKTSTEL